MMKSIILLQHYLFQLIVLDKQKTLSNSIKKSTTKLDESEKRITLRDFVENIYINALNTFEGEKIV